MNYKIDTTTNKHSGKNNSKEFIMLHHTGSVASLENMTTYLSENPAQVSAHYVIDTNGDIARIATDDYVLWHAGTGDLIKDYEDIMNYHSIGIEVISNGKIFTKKQIEALEILVKEIKERNSIETSNIIRHKDYSTRKWDIGDNFYKGYNSFEEWREQFNIPLIPEDDSVKSDYEKYLERGFIETPQPDRIMTERLYGTLRERELTFKK